MNSGLPGAARRGRVPAIRAAIDCGCMAVQILWRGGGASERSVGFQRVLNACDACTSLARWPRDDILTSGEYITCRPRMTRRFGKQQLQQQQQQQRTSD